MRVHVVRLAGMTLGLAVALAPVLLAVFSFFLEAGLIMSGASVAVPTFVALIILNVLATRVIAKRLFPVARRLISAG